MINQMLVSHFVVVERAKSPQKTVIEKVIILGLLIADTSQKQNRKCTYLVNYVTFSHYSVQK